jgi:uncharacterized protein with PIN domain
MHLSDPEIKKNSITKQITFRFYAELNDFLPAEKKGAAFIHRLKTPVSVREAIESLGIPLSEVDLVLINSQPVEMNHPLHENDYVSVYPVFESFDISTLSKIRRRPLRTTTFILDAHLGKLAKYLRMLGFDTLYRNDFGDREIIEIAEKENRIILTRDKLLLRSKKVDHGYYVRETEKHKQLIEVVQKFDLSSQFRSFTRCMTCNAQLIRKGKAEIQGKIDSDTARIFHEFFYCPACDKVFWKGSHFERMERLILSLINKSC